MTDRMFRNTRPKNQEKICEQKEIIKAARRLADPFRVSKGKTSGWKMPIK
jgi:hypothetical protein